MAIPAIRGIFYTSIAQVATSSVDQYSAPSSLSSRLSPLGLANGLLFLLAPQLTPGDKPALASVSAEDLAFGYLLAETP